MELIEFKSKILEGKYLCLPRQVSEKIQNIDEVDVVLKLKNIVDQGDTVESSEDDRMRRAFEQYKEKYPDELVDMGDFQYVGILQKGDSEINKSALIKTIEEKYNDI